MTKLVLRVGGGLCAVSVIALVVASNAPPKDTTPQLLTAKKRDDFPKGLARKLAAMKTFAPAAASVVADSPDRASSQDWLQHSTPGLDIPFEAFERARRDWAGFRARPARAAVAWVPLGPTYGKGPFNPYRDRSVYNAGTDNFGGRTIHGVISPDCTDAACTLWIANAGGGVWRTKNALAPEPAWEYISDTFEHNNIGSLALDPNDPTHQTIWAGTGEPNACGSGCEAGVGVYRSRDGGDTWSRVMGKHQFNGRAVGSMAIKPGNSSVIFAASGRGIRGLSNTCCGGADAIIPGAPHFGLYRSLNGGRTWSLVHQGAVALCTLSTPDQVALNQTPCAARGARRVAIDPVDANTVYVSYFSRGIWRSQQNGDPGTWEQIMAPVGPLGTTERPEFDVVANGGETRMYVGVGGGVMNNPAPPPAPPTISAYARFRRNDGVRAVPAATVTASWVDLTSSVQNTPGYSSFGYCDPQCSYDNYVYVPPGADADTVYLLGDNEYTENNFVTGRSNGRAVLLSTNAGVHFTDMTEDNSDNVYPSALHPDHHALVTNPTNWRQFFDLSDGGVARSNGVFIDDSADCAAPPKSYTGDRLSFCQLVLSRVPERLDAINKGLRTLHFYQIEYNKHDPDVISGGTQDNGSWETLGDVNTWINTNVADGGHNAYDALGGDPNFKMTAWQGGQIENSYNPQDQVDVNWISDTLFVFYGNEGSPFIASAITDPLLPGWLWTGREHVFRSTNYGRAVGLSIEKHRQHCNVWTGDGDIDEDGTYEPATDLCDDWQPLGNPAAAGRLTNASYGADRTGGHVALVERAKNDVTTLWAATSTGRIFISKNASNATPSAVTFTRLDALATNDPPRYPTAVFVDPLDANHAWISYSGFNAKTPDTPGHVFEIRYVPATETTPASATFTNLDGTGRFAFGDIPANSIIVSERGTIYVGTDFGVVQRGRFVPGWHRTAPGLPNTAVADLVLVPERDVLYAATHGQGVWQLNVR